MELEDPRTPDEIKQAIRNRRQAIDMLMDETQVLIDLLNKKIGVVAVIAFMAEFNKTAGA